MHRQLFFVCHLLLKLSVAINIDGKEDFSLWGDVSTFALCASGWPSADCERILDQSQPSEPEDNCHGESLCERLISDDKHPLIDETYDVAETRSIGLHVRLLSPSNGSIQFDVFAVHYECSTAKYLGYFSKVTFRSQLFVDGALLERAVATHDSIFFVPPLSFGWHTLAVRVTSMHEYAEAAVSVLVRAPPR